MVMLRAWRWYQRCLASHPVKTQIVSSGVLWGLGDIAAQKVTHSMIRNQQQHSHHSFEEKDKDPSIDWRRVASASMFGVAFVGPVGHHWYEFLDRYIRLRLQLRPKSMKFVTTKVAADGLIFGPLDLLVYFTYIGFASGKSAAQVKEDVKRDFLPGLAVGLGIWPVIQIVNFRYVPVQYQLLYVNIFCLLDSCFLSWLDQQGDAPWKKWFASLHTLEKQKGQS